MDESLIMYLWHLLIKQQMIVEMIVVRSTPLRNAQMISGCLTSFKNFVISPVIEKDKLL